MNVFKILSVDFIIAFILCLSFPLMAQESDSVGSYTYHENEIFSEFAAFEKNKGKVASLRIRRGGFESDRIKVVTKWTRKLNNFDFKTRETERRRNLGGVTITFRKVKVKQAGKRYRLRYEDDELVFFEFRTPGKRTRIALGKYIEIKDSGVNKSKTYIAPYESNIIEPKN